MYAKAIVGGKLIRFRLSPELARAHRANAGKTMSDEEAVEFVKRKRRALALRRAKPYLAQSFLTHAFSSSPPCLRR